MTEVVVNANVPPKPQGEDLIEARRRLMDDPLAINDVLAMLDQTYLAETMAGRPTHYDMNVSVVCNIKCPFCPRQTLTEEVVSGFMKPEHFEPVVPHFETSHRTGLYGLGEPFLHKKFFDFLAAAKSRGSYCMTSTHGMSLTPENIEKILDSGLDELCVSMDGATRRTFNFLRDGADFDTVTRNVRALTSRRWERGQTKPLINVATAVSKYNVWQMSAMVKLAHSLGADRITFSNLVLDKVEHAHVSIVGTRVFRFNLWRAIRTAERLQFPCTYYRQKPLPWLKEWAPEPSPEMRFGCPTLWRAVIVERDGNIKPCCYMNTTFGNTAARSIPEALNGPEARALRRTFLDGNYEKACKGCHMFTGITPERTVALINGAEHAARNGVFSEATRQQLLHVIEHYRDIAEKRGIPARGLQAAPA